MPPTPAIDLEPLVALPKSTKEALEKISQLVDD